MAAADTNPLAAPHARVDQPHPTTALPDQVLVAVAWPYVNGPPHLGHLAGMILPADIFARYHRMIGNDVLMVSGSDMHGTPTALKAQQEGVPPEVVANRYHAIWVDAFDRLGLQYDLYTTTETANHYEVAQGIFSRLLKNGHLFESTQSMPYCEAEKRFLPDRFVEGVCPRCDFADARGDQCDNCGAILDPSDLLGIRCTTDGTTPVFRDTTHYMFGLGAFENRLREWISSQDHWRPQVKNMPLGMIRDGLPDRAITRDLEWGVTVPVEGYEHKRIYVWFEALIGYLSATIEWAKKRGEPDAWKRWWINPDARSYYFLGKDNIPFHTIIWPAMLMGCNFDPPYNLPYDIPANEFLTLEGKAFSTSRNWANDVEALERYDPDAIRYCLTAIMPETSDSDFRWSTFVSRNNNELVATLGNFVHRVLSLTHQNSRGVLPAPGTLDDADQAALAACDSALGDAGKHIADRRFRDGLRVVMALAQHGNRYIDARAPWETAKTDRERTATTLWTALNMVATLRTICYPFLPFSSAKMHRLLGGAGDVLNGGWARNMPEPGGPLPEPEALFRKLDESVIDEELARLRSATAA